MFPKIGVPPNHPILIGFSIIFTIHFGGPPLLLETPISNANAAASCFFHPKFQELPQLGNTQRIGVPLRGLRWFLWCRKGEKLKRVSFFGSNPVEVGFWKKKMREKQLSRWFQVTFLSPSWRSLNL